MQPPPVELFDSPFTAKFVGFTFTLINPQPVTNIATNIAANSAGHRAIVLFMKSPPFALCREERRDQCGSAIGARAAADRAGATVHVHLHVPAHVEAGVRG